MIMWSAVSDSPIRVMGRGRRATQWQVGDGSGAVGRETVNTVP